MPENTFEAVMDLLELDDEFLLFRHEKTGEDARAASPRSGRAEVLDAGEQARRGRALGGSPSARVPEEEDRSSSWP